MSKDCVAVVYCKEVRANYGILTIFIMQLFKYAATSSNCMVLNDGMDEW
jgi:hypothetical protein